MTNEEIGPIKVKCSLTGKPAGNWMKLSGKCTAALIFSRPIGAEIELVSDGRLVGIYTGSRIGDASLSGRAIGNTVHFATTWPRAVFGDTEAVMTLTNNGKGRFTMVVTDRVGGKTTLTTQVDFERRI